MKEAVIYVHGRGGSAAEAARYRPLFPGREVLGLEYTGDTPWEAGAELYAAVAARKAEYGALTLIANSIGAYFCMFGGIGPLLKKAYFISPVVDMEALILNMMAASGVTEAALEARGEVPSSSGETLSWEYLRRVRAQPVRWDVPTAILYGGCDTLTSLQTVSAFARAHGAALTVMENGGHWFHTAEELRFLDAWLLNDRIEVSPLRVEETPAALALAWKVFCAYESPVYPPEGTEEFRKSIQSEVYLAGIVYYGAFDGAALVGVLGIRKQRRHICFFFLDGAYHRRGIGTRLFCRARGDFPGEITLNAAPFGLPFYKKLGFVPTAEEQTVNGIRFTPMRLSE